MNKPQYFLSELSRPWDSFDAYLFDIDGTLITNKDAVHYFAFCDALTHIAGRPVNLDGVTTHGNTDIGILRDALTRCGIPSDVWRPLLSEACAGMGQYVIKHQEELRVQLLPGVRDLLDHLQSRGALLGVATGNLEVIGKLKLEAVGLLPVFVTGSYSDSLESRTDVFQRALTSARQCTSAPVTCCIVGDTPADVLAAHANDVESVAVATGVYGFEELMCAKPSACVGTFLDLLEHRTIGADES